MFIVGTNAVGKTCFIKRLYPKFNNKFFITVSIEFKYYPIKNILKNIKKNMFKGLSYL